MRGAAADKKNGDIKDKITIASLDELQSELRAFKAALSVKETEHTWEALDRAIKRFTAVTRGGACRFENDYIAALRDRDVSRAVLGCIATERTQLSASALIFISATTRLGPAFSPLVAVYLPTIVRLLGRTNKLYISRATACLLAIVRNTRLASVLPYFANGMDEKSVSYRKGCIQCVLCAMGGDEPDSLDFLVDREVVERRYLPDVEKCIRIGARDKDLETRAMAKRCWAIYGHNFPHLVAVFIAPLTPISRRNLELPAASLGASTASVASSSLARSQPVARPLQQSTQFTRSALPASTASTRDDAPLRPVSSVQHHPVVTKQKDVKRSPSKEVHAAVARTKVMRRQQETQPTAEVIAAPVAELHTTLPMQPVWRSFSQPVSRQADPLHRSEPQVSLLAHQPSAAYTHTSSDVSHNAQPSSSTTQPARSSFRRPAARAAQPSTQNNNIKAKASRVFLPLTTSTSAQSLTEEAAAIPLPSSTSNRDLGNVVPLKRPASALSIASSTASVVVHATEESDNGGRPASSASQASVASATPSKLDDGSVELGETAEREDDTVKIGRFTGDVDVQTATAVEPEQGQPDNDEARSTTPLVEPLLPSTQERVAVTASSDEVCVDPPLTPPAPDSRVLTPQKVAVAPAAVEAMPPKALQSSQHSTTGQQQARRVPFRPQRPAVAQVPMTQTARRVPSALPPQSQKQQEQIAPLRSSQPASGTAPPQTMHDPHDNKASKPAVQADKPSAKILTHRSSSASPASKPAAPTANKRLKPDGTPRANIAQLRAQPSVSELRAKPLPKASGGIFARLAAPTASSSAKTRNTVPRSASGSSVSSQSDARASDKTVFKKPQVPAQTKSTQPAQKALHKQPSKALLQSPKKEAWKPQPRENHSVESTPISELKLVSTAPSTVDKAVEVPLPPSPVEEAEQQARTVQSVPADLASSMPAVAESDIPDAMSPITGPALGHNTSVEVTCVPLAEEVTASVPAASSPDKSLNCASTSANAGSASEMAKNDVQLPEDLATHPDHVQTADASKHEENDTHTVIHDAAVPLLTETHPTPLSTAIVAPIDDTVLFKPTTFDISTSQLMLQQEPTRRLSDGETLLQAQAQRSPAPASHANGQVSVLYELFGTPRQPFRPTAAAARHTGHKADPLHAEMSATPIKRNGDSGSIPHSAGFTSLSEMMASQKNLAPHDSDTASSAADEPEDVQIIEEDDDVALLITRELSDTSLEELQSRFEESRLLQMPGDDGLGEDAADCGSEGADVDEVEATPMRPRHAQFAHRDEIDTTTGEAQGSHSGSRSYESSDPDADDFSLTQILPPSLRKPMAASAGPVTAKRTYVQHLPHTFPMFSKGLQQHIIDSSPSRAG